ncbi:MAG: hypothetical protein IIC22_06860 [Chloroflexi bacterium]|nr:hypothetical protein [Chloroflexota bacterium]
MLETTYCDRHSKTETNLRCGRCDTLICPRCLVHAPVGVRCPKCAKTKRLPTFEVSGLQLARAVGASLAIGIAGGFAIVLFILLVPAPFLLFLVAFVAVGYLVGEGTSLSVNRKRGRGLKLVAGGGMFAAFMVSVSFGIAGPLFFTSLSGVLAFGVAFYLAIKPF